MSALGNWLLREMLRRGAASVVVRAADATIGTSRIRRDKPELTVEDVESSVAESAPEHRAIMVEVRTDDGSVLAARTVRGSGGRDDVGATGLLGQLMRHNEKLASETSRMFAQVLDAALSENRRLSDALGRAEELRQESFVAKERLLTQATERDLILRKANKDEDRKERLMREVTEKWAPAIIGHFQSRQAVPAIRGLLKAIARKSPDELQAIVSKLEPAEAASLEQLWGAEDNGTH